MDIRIYKTSKLNFRAETNLCFECDSHIRKALLDADVQGFYGVMIIDTLVAEFYYSPFGNDGTIEDNGVLSVHQRALLKRLVPMFAYSEYWKWKD